MMLINVIEIAVGIQLTVRADIMVSGRIGIHDLLKFMEYSNLFGLRA